MSAARTPTPLAARITRHTEPVLEISATGSDAADVLHACNSHDALVAALFDLVRYHEDGDYAQHMDERARAATDGNVSALEALCATASAALKAAKGEA